MKTFYDGQKQPEGFVAFLGNLYYKFPGTRTIRVLEALDFTAETGFKEEYVHYVPGLRPQKSTKRGSYFICTNQKYGNVNAGHCAICNQEMQLVKENSEHKPNRPSKNFVLRVIDRSLVKVHPENEKGYPNYQNVDGSWPEVDYTTKKSLAEVEASVLNQERILTLSKTMFNKLTNLNAGRSVTEYDIGIVTTREAGADKNSYDMVSTWEDKSLEELGITFEPFDLEMAGDFYKFTEEELTEVIVNKVRLEDIWEVRKANRAQEAKVEATEEQIEEVVAEASALDDEMEALINPTKEE